MIKVTHRHNYHQRKILANLINLVKAMNHENNLNSHRLFTSIT